MDQQPLSKLQLHTGVIVLGALRAQFGENIVYLLLEEEANKIDVMGDPSRLEALRKHLDAAGVPLYPVSGATGEGLPELLEAIWREVARSLQPTAV